MISIPVVPPATQPCGACSLGLCLPWCSPPRVRSGRPSAQRSLTPSSPSQPCQLGEGGLCQCRAPSKSHGLPRQPRTPNDVRADNRRREYHHHHHHHKDSFAPPISIISRRRRTHNTNIRLEYCRGPSSLHQDTLRLRRPRRRSSGTLDQQGANALARPPGPAALFVFGRQEERRRLQLILLVYLPYYLPLSLLSFLLFL